MDPEPNYDRDREMQARTHTAHQLFAIGEGSRFFRLFSTRQRPHVLVSDAWPAPATYHRSFCEHCCPWSRVGRYIDTCRGCVFSLAAVCWLALAYLTGALPSLLLKPGNTPYPFPGLGSKGASLPCMANEKVAAALFMVSRWG